jgi:hypothetical protein
MQQKVAWTEDYDRAAQIPFSRSEETANPQNEILRCEVTFMVRGRPDGGSARIFQAGQ